MDDNVAQLYQNLDLVGIRERVIVLPFALCDSDSEQEFQVDDLSSQSGALSAVKGGDASQGRKRYRFSPKSKLVACRRLDSLIHESNLPAPDVMKVDIEGAEKLFLSGARDCLSRHSPKLVIELHGVETARSVFDFLSSVGYTCTARVSERLSAAQYCRLDQSIMREALRFYDVQWLLAAKNPDDLPARVALFE